MGALPTLRAATDPGAQNGEYYGPGGIRNSAAIRNALSQAHSRTTKTSSVGSGRYPKS